MPGAGERTYAYAKACGILGKSFVGKRISQLAGVSRLAELDRLVFPGELKDLPEGELLVDIEDRIIHRAVNQIIRIVNSFLEPPELFLQLVRTYEYEDLKTALGALAQGETKNPGFTNIGHFRTVAFEAYPDLDAMLKGTRFKFLLTKYLQHDQAGHFVNEKEWGNIVLQTELDHHYYTSLWESLLLLPKNDRIAFERLLSEEISLRNAVWALRLRTYYQMPPEEIQERLIRIKKQKSFTAAAMASLSMSLDRREEWSRWKWASLLNPETSQSLWKVDPRYFQNAASKYLYHRARFSFRQRPLSLDSIFCFIKLKQFEEDILISLAEGLRMGMSSQDVFTLLEVEL